MVLLGVALISLGILVVSIPSIASVRVENRFTVEFTKNVTVEPESSLYLWIPFRESNVNVSITVSIEGSEIGFETYVCPGKPSECPDEVDWLYGRNTPPCNAMQSVTLYRRISQNFNTSFRADLSAPYYIMLDNTFSQTPKNVTLVLRLTWSEAQHILQGFRGLGVSISVVGAISFLLGFLLSKIREAVEKTRRWLTYSLRNRICHEETKILSRTPNT